MGRPLLFTLTITDDDDGSRLFTRIDIIVEHTVVCLDVQMTLTR